MQKPERQVLAFLSKRFFTISDKNYIQFTVYKFEACKLAKPADPYAAHSNGRCPHCRRDVFFAEAKRVPLMNYLSSTELETQSAGNNVHVYSSQCPSCLKPIVVAKIKVKGNETIHLVHPFNITRTVPPEVPQDIAEDFLEASSVLSTSEKASAALSRRCLQNLLTQRGFTDRDLCDQIDDALPTLPARIAANLDAIRNIGNFAAHVIKHQSTGTIVQVEPEEAAWNLDVLEELFDHYYVVPARNQEKRAKLDAKLAEAGKRPMKQP
jgi:hypothetical protein